MILQHQIHIINPNMTCILNYLLVILTLEYKKVNSIRRTRPTQLALEWFLVGCLHMFLFCGIEFQNVNPRLLGGQQAVEVHLDEPTQYPPLPLEISLFLSHWRLILQSNLKHWEFKLVHKMTQYPNQLGYLLFTISSLLRLCWQASDKELNSLL